MRAHAIPPWRGPLLRAPKCLIYVPRPRGAPRTMNQTNGTGGLNARARARAMLFVCFTRVHPFRARIKRRSSPGPSPLPGMRAARDASSFVSRQEVPLVPIHRFRSWSNPRRSTRPEFRSPSVPVIKAGCVLLQFTSRCCKSSGRCLRDAFLRPSGIREMMNPFRLALAR